MTARPPATVTTSRASPRPAGRDPGGGHGHVGAVHGRRQAHVPDGADKIVFDRFHIMVHMGTAVDTVRMQEHRLLRRQGLNTLTGSKYLWLYAEENLPDIYQARFAALKAANLKTARAWAIKESLRALWHYHRPAWARGSGSSGTSGPPTAACTPSSRSPASGPPPHRASSTTSPTRVTNATGEGLNSKIRTIKKMAYGYRNQEHFKIAIFFHCGGLDLYPRTLTHGIAG